MKILFTDLDGTLLTRDKRISDADLASIRRMIGAGHRFVIASGRPLPSVLKLVDEYDLNRPNFYVSCFNGSLIYDCYEKKTIRQITVSYEDAQYLFDCAAKEGLHVHTYSDTHVVSHHETEEMTYYLAHIHMPGLVSKDVKKYLTHEPCKLIVMSFESRLRLQEFQKKMAPFEEGRLSHTYSCDYMLEYAALEASKGASIRVLCADHGIPVSDAVAVGDEENDISMIDAAGVGVAMKNATDAVKSHADYITQRDNDHDAITEVIERFIL
ncbi:MAG: HAD family phosphatase [Lachnospiraceae bacterium]|nr:HAD family phosphatase [Lachnospiraceae bacterium]